VPASAFTIIPDSAEHIRHVSSDSSILARHGLLAGRYALTVGNQAPNKNIALAVRAFLRAELPGWRLAVAGGGSNRIFGSGAVEEAASVAHLGRVTDEELRALYENAGLFLFPSRYEGFGVPPLEAMTLGCPVLSSDAAAMPEVLGTAAAYFRSDDEADLAVQIGRLGKDELLRRDLASRGLARAAAFSWHAGAGVLRSLL
jgi:glycosyltransferase involved in cell wall biosynthesis